MIAEHGVEGQAAAAPGRALVAQLIGAVVAGALALLAFPGLISEPLAWAGTQGLGAALASWLLRGPLWWLPLHLGFVPLAILAQRLELSPWIWLGGFILLLLIFWRTDRSRVPLYLTNARTSAAVAAQLPATASTMLDLGCGDGGLIRRVSNLRPDCRFVGYEHAPLTCAWAWLMCRGKANIEIRLGDFWSQSFADYTLVYAFLSPTPMAQLWIKAKNELNPSAELISNSFEIPGIAAERTIQVADGRKTLLFCYRPAHESRDVKKHHDCPPA